MMVYIENMTQIDLNCPRCHEPINFFDQLKDWIDMPDVDDIGPPTLLNLWCDKCDDMTSSLYWEANEEAFEIEVPNLRDFTGGIDRLMINRPKK
jgi:hypothetical protein